MPSKPPVPAERATGDPPPRTGSLRTDLGPSAGVGVVMGFIAATEGAGAGYGSVVGVAGCAAVLGMLALKRAYYRP